MRGGGKSGSSNDGTQSLLTTRTYTDPVDGTVFTDTPFQEMATGYSASRALNEHIAARQAAAQTKSDTAAAQTASDTAAKESAFQTAKSAATQSAQSDIENEFRRQGLDPTQYAGDISSSINRAASGIQDLDPNPASAFSSTLGSDIINSLQSGARTAATNTLNQTFTPNYTQTALPYSASSPYVENLLSEQFDPLNAQLTNAQKRGTLNDAGYNQALSVLSQKKDAARSTLNSLASGVIDQDRSTLNDYISGARTGVGNTSLSGLGSFDPTQYTDPASTMVSTDLSSLGGDIRNKLGSTQFATLTDLLNAGGAQQGATNPAAIQTAGQTAGQSGGAGASPTAAALTQQEQQRRGLSGTGTF
jgi:hypothetical protein